MGAIHSGLVGSAGASRRATAFTFAANASNQTVAIASLSGYIAGKSCITITINSGVYVYSTSTATPAITVTGGTTGDVLSIVNLGKIMGMGGTAGAVNNGGASGGNAISLSYPATINNTNASAYIGGGGGGAAGNRSGSGGGGGAGGGTGGNGFRTSTNCAEPYGGAGGAVGLIGSNAAGPSPGNGGGAGGGGGGTLGGCTQHAGGGGGGGRIFPGTGGLGNTDHGCGGAAGLNGGAGNAVGGSYCGNNCLIGGAGGGGWGASGGTNSQLLCVNCSIVRFTYTGGSGGKAIALNGKSVTWVGGCTARVYGGVS